MKYTAPQPRREVTSSSPPEVPQISHSLEVKFLTQENAVDMHTWVESLNIRDDGRGKTYRSCQIHEPVSLHGRLSTGHHLLEVSFITSPKQTLCTL